MAKAITLWRDAIKTATKPRITNQLADRHVLRVIIDFCERTLLWEEKLDAIEILEDINGYQLSSSNGRILAADHVDIGVRKILPTSEDNLDEGGSEFGPGWRASKATTGTKYYVDRDRILYLIPQPTAASDAYASLTDLTFDASGKTITSAGTNLEDADFDGGQRLIVTGSSSNDRVFTISSVSDKVITVNEIVTDEGSGDASAVLSVKGLIVWVNMVPTRVDNTNDGTEGTALAATTVENFIYNDHYETIRSGALERIFKIPGEKYSDLEKGEYYAMKYEKGWHNAAKLKKKGYAARATMNFSA